MSDDLIASISIYQLKPVEDNESVSPERTLARKMSRPPKEVVYLPDFLTVSEFQNLCQDLFVCLIFDPHFWYSEKCWKRWLQALEEDGCRGKINVPLGNQDPSWREGLQIPLYLTVSGLEKVAEFKGPKKWMVRQATRPENFCVSVLPISILRECPEQMPLSMLPAYLAEKKTDIRVFCSGWLHNFSILGEAGCRHDLLAMTDWKGLVLELGCGTGLMAKTCKEMGNEVTWIGLDLDPEVISKARTHLDLALLADANRDLPFSSSVYFDRIVCGDFLEHMDKPWKILSNLRKLTSPEGLLIVSVPNIGHWLVLKDILSGRWDEAPSGVLCVTHLRFGTKKTWKRWLNASGWNIVKIEAERLPLPPDWTVPINQMVQEPDIENLESVTYKILARPNFSGSTN